MWPCCRVALGVSRLCYHVNPPSCGTVDLRCPHDSEKKHLAWPRGAHQAHCSPLGARLHCTLSAASQVWLTAEEGQFKDVYTARLQILFVLGNRLSVPATTSRSPRCFPTRVCGDSGGAGATSWTRDGKAEMSVQSRVRLLNGSRHLAEVSVFPSVPCLRRSVSVPEIPCLQRPTPCPQAMATLV